MQSNTETCRDDDCADLLAVLPARAHARHGVAGVILGLTTSRFAGRPLGARLHTAEAMGPLDSECPMDARCTLPTGRRRRRHKALTCDVAWSGRRESNPRSQLGKLMFCL